MLTAVHQSLWKIKRFLFVTAHQQPSDQPAAMETKKLFKMAERVFEPRVCTFTRAARAPLDWGSSPSSPGVSIEPVASDANAAGAGSAGCTRLSSRQVLSRLYSMSTRQWRFLELYSTRLINRPKPWCAEYKRKRRTKGHSLVENTVNNKSISFIVFNKASPAPAHQSAAPVGCSGEREGRSSELSISDAPAPPSSCFPTLPTETTS